MIAVSDERFSALLTKALDELPQQYVRNLDNVAITYADEPTPEQLTKQGVRRGNLLLGLYEGIPQTQRGAGYHLVLPDKITIFKLPLCQITANEADLFEQTKRTLWHEIAHHYGLSHVDIDSRENGVAH